jgi:hypothetical protein
MGKTDASMSVVRQALALDPAHAHCLDARAKLQEMQQRMAADAAEAEAAQAAPRVVYVAEAASAAADEPT